MSMTVNFHGATNAIPWGGPKGNWVDVLNDSGCSVAIFTDTFEQAVDMAKGINDAISMAGPREIVRDEQIDLEDAIAEAV